jgi:DNA replication protein DnaD
MDWFRFYSEVVRDPKVQKLTPTMFKHWVNVLCLASDNEPRGRVPMPEEVAFHLRISRGKAVDVLDELLHLSLIDGDGQGNFEMHNWNARQYKSDNVTERVRKHRRNVSVTPPDTETEQRQNRAEAEPDQTTIVVPVVRAFERCFGRMLGPMEVELIHALDEEHPRERIDYALRESAALGKRSVRYIQTICENQAKDNDSHERKPVGRNSGAAQAPIDTTAAYAAVGIRADQLPVRLPVPGREASGVAALDGVDDQSRVASQ